MSARIVCVANQKGGCGKTTITMALAYTLARLGYRVLVVDADMQGSASSWSANAPDDAPFPAPVINLAHAGKSLPSEVRKLVRDYEIILIDCPPAVDSPIPQASLLIADLALIPLKPSPIDVSAATPFLHLVHQVMTVNPALRGLIVPNLVDEKTKITRAYLAHYSQLALPSSRTLVVSRTSHVQAVALGSSVSHPEIRDKKATAEIASLADEVLELLGERPVMQEAAP